MFIRNNDQKKALELLRLNKKECESMIEIAKNVANVMRLQHKSDIDKIKSNLELMAESIGSEAIKDIMKTQKRHQENLENHYKKQEKLLEQEELD